ncbi:hypothetical protein [Texcoconibacillus texcoconensis]|uniref:Putative branched-subunit amino acid permease n=1 Tax=Texcoconibacillus texcoconensis TaxID=1095777 RepID=A0A840QRB7_9BACI|nr:hypothetical protein [Texcoconibacillus texcoconensis]MBB5174002.1 putative branched-subunit amino acid permease [Texcoconibacillus texcoconensis]
MPTSRMMKWITGSFEILLGIPILGATIVIGMYWLPLLFMLALHIVTLILSSRDGVHKHGSILGIVTSCVAWIPFVGMVMHIVTGILLMVDAAQRTEPS